MYKIFCKKIKENKGMTLVELLVVLTIFMIVAGFTIFDYGRFRSTTSLQNLSDDVALSIRRAQNFAIGVKGSQLSDFSKGYGINFSTLAPVALNARASSNKTFIIFKDINANKKYDYLTSSSTICNSSSSVDNDECVDMLNITSADIVSSICPYVSGSSTCSPILNGSVDITFLRPNPDAYICPTSLDIGFFGACGNYSSVDIVVKNIQNGSIKTINVSNVGQISIK